MVAHPTPSISSPPPFRDYISDAEQRAGESLPPTLYDLIDDAARTGQIGCSTCDSCRDLPMEALRIPAWFHRADHRLNARYWTLLAKGDDEEISDALEANQRTLRLRARQYWAWLADQQATPQGGLS